MWGGTFGAAKLLPGFTNGLAFVLFDFAAKGNNVEFLRRVCVRHGIKKAAYAALCYLDSLLLPRNFMETIS